MTKEIGVVEPVDVSRKLYRVRVYIGDDMSGTENVYFDTRFAADRFVKQLPESTRTEFSRQEWVYVGDQGDFCEVIVDGNVDFLALADAVLTAQRKTPEG